VGNGRDCYLHMYDDQSVTAVFDVAPVHIAGTSAYFLMIQDAYDVQADAQKIELHADTFNEAVVCDRPVRTVIQGGFDSGFQTPFSLSMVDGSLTIINGTVTVDSIVIR